MLNIHSPVNPTDLIKIPFDTLASDAFSALTSSSAEIFDSEDPTTVITSGVSVTNSADAVAGQNLVTIDGVLASLLPGHEYVVRLSAGTVNSGSIAGTIIARFMVQKSTLYPSVKNTFGKYNLHKR